MGTLRRADGEALFHLPSRCLVGRSGACDLVLAEKNVSGHHAALEWQGGSWQVQDLGSRNGTFVDEQRIDPQARAVVVAGTRLRFGRDAPTWELVDAGEPRAMARNLGNGQTRVAEGGYLALPDPDAPECSVFQLPQGDWVLERDGEQTPALDRATIAAASGDLWRIFLPVALPGTVQDGAGALLVAQMRLRFRVSRDEEQVELTGFLGDRRLDLQIRAHHYPLLLLARRRLADRAAGAPEPDQGWMALDDLLRMLQLTEVHFNITIHRARTQLGKLGVADAASLVERQPRTRRLRLGVSQLEVGPLE